MTAKVPPNGLLFFQEARSPRRSLPWCGLQRGYAKPSQS